MSIIPSISPTDLRDYLKGRGWAMVPEAIRDRLYVLNHPRLQGRQLVFPMDVAAPDYTESIALALEKLAGIDSVSMESMLSNLGDLRSDAIRFRLYGDQDFSGSLPLPFASTALEAAQKSLMASACSVLRPRPHHPRLALSEAQQLVNAARFRHTETGSFVLKVACPIDAVDVSAALIPDEVDAPFARRTVLNLKRALHGLVTAIEADTLSELVAEAKREAASPLSSNLCEAITRFHDEGIKNSLDISFAWSGVIQAPSDPDAGAIIRIQRDYFPRIEEVRRSLLPQERHHEDMFVGTVEVLNGDMGEDGRRSGEVILALQLPEGEIVRARVNLTAEDYAKADRAHMTEGTYIKVVGRLNPGRQPRSLTMYSHFELISQGEVST
jgi:hypothetical protein